MICSFELIIGLPVSTQPNHNFANVNIVTINMTQLESYYCVLASRSVSRLWSQAVDFHGASVNCCNPSVTACTVTSDIQQFYALPTDTEELFCNPDGVCLLRGTDCLNIKRMNLSLWMTQSRRHQHCASLNVRWLELHHKTTRSCEICRGASRRHEVMFCRLYVSFREVVRTTEFPWLYTSTERSGDSGRASCREIAWTK